jgi:hypothetical protein
MVITDILGMTAVTLSVQVPLIATPHQVDIQAMVILIKDSLITRTRNIAILANL